jgi:hypothetical protein
MLAFALTGLATLGGYMLMPFGSAYTVHNLGIDLEKLPILYLVTGASAIAVGPLVGRASDAHGKFNVFLFGAILTMVMVAIYTNLGTTPLPWVLAVNVLLGSRQSGRLHGSEFVIAADLWRSCLGPGRPDRGSTQRRQAGALRSARAHPHHHRARDHGHDVSHPPPGARRRQLLTCRHDSALPEILQSQWVHPVSFGIRGGTVP